MGNVNENEQIRQLEMQELARHSNLSYQEVYNLWRVFQKLSESKQHDGVIDYEEYMSLFKAKNAFNTRLFHFIDINRDHVLNFREWVQGFSKFKAISNNSRMRLAFELLGDGEQSFDQTQMIGLLGGLLEELQLNLSEPELKQIVGASWPSQRAGLSCEQLKCQIEKHPEILEWLYYELQ